MRVVIAYKQQTDYARQVEEFLHDFKRQTNRDLETVDPDTAAGTLFCDAYDIVQYPTMIAISDDGVMQQTWVGLPLPTISEVSYYA
jgi:hypothetical protein